MVDLTTLQYFAVAWGLVGMGVVGWGWWSRRRRSRPRPIEELRANVRDRRESLRHAAATEYRSHKRTPWNP
jgi:hypothetical protein